MRTNILGHNLECVENPAYRTDWVCHSLSLYLLYWLQLQEFRFLSDKQLVWDKQWVWAHYVFINRQQHNYAEDYFISYVNNCLEVEDSSRNSETPEHMFVSIDGTCLVTNQTPLSKGYSRYPWSASAGYNQGAT